MPRFVFDRERGEMVEIAYDRDLPRPPSQFPSIMRDTPAYFSVASRRMVDGRRDRREDLARTGCREVDPSEFKATAWDPKNAVKFGLPHEPPPPTPEHVKKWQAGKLAQRAPVDAAPASPEMRQAAAAEAIRYAQTKT